VKSEKGRDGLRKMINDLESEEGRGFPMSLNRAARVALMLTMKEEKKRN
jgi:hypothetical protein